MVVDKQGVVGCKLWRVMAEQRSMGWLQNQKAASTFGPKYLIRFYAHFKHIKGVLIYLNSCGSKQAKSLSQSTSSQTSGNKPSL